MIISDTDLAVILTFFGTFLFGPPVLIGAIIIGTEICVRIEFALRKGN